MAKTIFEQTGGTYTTQGDYCLPNLTFHPKKNAISACGRSAAFGT